MSAPMHGPMRGPLNGQLWTAPAGAVEDAAAEIRLAQSYLAALQRLLAERKTSLTKQEQQLFNGALAELASAQDRIRSLAVCR